MGLGHIIACDTVAKYFFQFLVTLTSMNISLYSSLRSLLSMLQPCISVPALVTSQRTAESLVFDDVTNYITTDFGN